MKKIELRRIVLRNFKGIENATFDFGNGQNFIHGANRSGKTTLFDAFNWVLFDKNSANEKDFEIKTIRNNQVIHNLEHEVSASIDYDNRLIELKKVLVEKWTKKKGNPVAEMTGHETKYFIDGVPKSATEYKSFIDIIISESISRTITDPMYFNIVMPWKNRRELLFQLVGIQEEIEIANNSPEEIRSTVVAILNQGKSIEDEKKRIAVEKRRLNDCIDQIPARIDEVNRSLKELPEQSIEDLNKNKSDLKAKENSLIEQLENENKKFEDQNKEKQKQQQEVFELENKLQEEKNIQTRNLRETKDKLEDSISYSKQKEIKLNREKDDLQSEYNVKFHKLNLNKETKDKLLALYREENKRTFKFDESECKCPTCLTPFAPDKIKQKSEEAFKLFDETKLSNLSRIQKEGTELTKEIESLEKELESLKFKIESELPKQIHELKNKIEVYEKELSELKEIDFTSIPELIAIEKQIHEKKDKIQNVEVQDNTAIKEQLQQIKVEIETINESISIFTHNESVEKRIEELKSELKNLNQEKADLEQIEFKLESFVKFKIKNIEEKVNNSFKIVNFKMFNELLNGGFEETCICTVDGVSFKNLNNELKVNAGLDIIQTLQKFFNISAPIFIDNRESVSEIIVNDEVQIINLVVDSNCKQLTQK